MLPCYSRERNPDLATRPTRIADRELNCSQRRERDVEFPKQKKRSEIIKKQKAGKTVSCPVTNRDPVGHFIKRRLRIRFGAGCCASSFNPPASLKQERKRRKFGKCNIQHVSRKSSSSSFSNRILLQTDEMVRCPSGIDRTQQSKQRLNPPSDRS